MPENFTEQIIEFIRKKGRPVTTSEIVDAVGMSRAAGYQWRDRNLTAGVIVPAGKGRAGADAFALAEAAPGVTTSTSNGSTSGRVATAPTTAASAIVQDIRLGDKYHVAQMRLNDDGRTVVTLVSDSDEADTFEVIV